MSNNDYAVIMAGGGGTRLWPASRKNRPKQLMKLGLGDRSLLRAAVDRAAAVVGLKNVLVVTAQSQAEAVQADLPMLSADQILAEPVGRNTAPCIGLAALYVYQRNLQANLAVLPADHHIGDTAEFSRIVAQALEQSAGGQIVTLGIKPSRPETGYGYIETGGAVTGCLDTFWAREFKEKPDRQTALQYLDAGNFLWNSGMFFMTAKRILNEIERFLPDLSAKLFELSESLKKGTHSFVQKLNTVYPTIKPISIDYGVMEKVDALQVIPARFGWNDVGSWQALAEIHPGDAQGNVSLGDNYLIDVNDCVVFSDDGRQVALLGVEDLVVVSSGEGVLVCPKARAQQVRRVVEQLKRTQKTDQ
jgi:mannose-1-phosphate guanylyltransferase